MNKLDHYMMQAHKAYRGALEQFRTISEINLRLSAVEAAADQAYERLQKVLAEYNGVMAPANEAMAAK